MEILIRIWPFVVGQQIFILYFGCLAVFGLIVLNVFTAFRQKLSIQKVLSGIFNEIETQNKTEKILRLVLLNLLWVSFFVLVIDTQINGIQIINEL